MAIELSSENWERIGQHGTATYPNECGGFLLGKEQDGRKRIFEVVAVQNVWEHSELNPYTVRAEDSTRNRFLVQPEDHLRIDREAREKGLDIVGFYHSHPDHPAKPSEFDRMHAWPWYSYVILTVEKGVPGEITSWVLNEDHTQFLREEVRVSDGGRANSLRP